MGVREFLVEGPRFVGEEVDSFVKEAFPFSDDERIVFGDSFVVEIDFKRDPTVIEMEELFEVIKQAAEKDGLMMVKIKEV